MSLRETEITIKAVDQNLEDVLQRVEIAFFRRIIRHRAHIRFRFEPERAQIGEKVPEDLEWDEADEHAYHVLATSSDGDPIGTGRLKQDCQIGRMAVLKEWRGRGVGAAILHTLIALAQKEGCLQVQLNAQTHALAFYRRYGFIATGEEFSEAGIAHRRMLLTLERGPANAR